MKQDVGWRNELGEYIVALAWSCDGQWLAAAPAVGGIKIFRSSDGTVAADFPGHGIENRTLSWHPHEPVLCTAGADAKLALHEMASRLSSRTVALGSGMVEKVGWNGTGMLLAAGVGKSLWIVTADGEIAHELPAHPGTVMDCGWSPTKEEEVALVCSGGGFLYDVKEGKLKSSFEWGGASLLMEWNPNGKVIATADQTPSLHYWDLVEGINLHMQGYPRKVTALAWDRKGEHLASASGEMLTIWNCTGPRGPENTEPEIHEFHSGNVISLDYSPIEQILASGAEDGLLALVRTGSYRDEPDFGIKRNEAVSCVRFSPDGKRIAFGTGKGELAVMQVPAD